MIADADPFAKLASLFGKAWFPYPSPIESERIRALGIRGMEHPSGLTEREVQELACSVAAYHRRKTKTAYAPIVRVDATCPASD